MAVENANATGRNRTLFPFRYLMAIMGSIGLAILYGFKVNASVAIVAMVNHTAVKSHIKLSMSNDSKTDNATLTSTNICQFDSISNVTIKAEDGPFVWNELIQGLILSSYFWGYTVSMLPSGRLAELWSAKWLMNVSVLLNLAASILTPVAARIHYWLFIAMRVLQGIGGGVSFPAMHVMIAKWAPLNERSVIASIVYAGTALGTVISVLLTGLLAANFGWESIFYIEGALCLIWCVLWWLMIADSPEEQTRFITKEEKSYIITSLGGHKKNIPKAVPWPQVFRSKPFMAILIAHFCSNFGWYMLLIELPTFMNQILKFDMSSNAGLSSVPFLCMWLFTMILSKVLTTLQGKGLITVTVSRKIGTLLASLVPMVCLIQVSYVGCDRMKAVVLMTIAVTCIGGMYSGFLANHIDIAPNFAGSLVAVTNFVATIPGFVVPIFVGQLTHGNQTIEAWRIVFLVTIILYIIEILVYTIFGSGNEQPWNQIEAPDEEANDQTLPLRRNNTK
ncbi:putative inorganic phosphate cotransporter isoform X1 [Monomorium pharaonis]|uniref:putative inorganic phosphate cotransporter isoform X1 n=1 Tax=Monomorium pharaonis TaxID=307658 RepID=UPI00063F3CB6|nr:putative inorganic phosphate cotransporter isoform X1 [Monomorium pharaonis]